MKVPPSRLGPQVARALAGAWRSEAPALDCSAKELAAIAPLLHKSGAAALIWRRIRGSPLASTPAADGLHAAYRQHTLEAAVHAHKTCAVMKRLDAAGVTSLVVKGAAVARHYPESGLRPYSDLDVIVEPGQAARARSALMDPSPLDYAVDIHDGPARLDALSFDDLAERRVRLPLPDCEVWVPGPEDELRILALHALRHGVFRPIWLVDLAVIVETIPRTFDWNRCVGLDRRRADWVLCALALAQRLLGARIEGTPVAGRAPSLPRWLSEAVLRSWNRCEGVSDREPVFRALAQRLHQPTQLWEEVRRRWDRPIQATLELRGPFNALPRWPFEVAAVAHRAPEIWRAIRDRR